MLYKYDSFFWVKNRVEMRTCMHYAWAEKDCWPRYITHPDPQKLCPTFKTPPISSFDEQFGTDGPELLDMLIRRDRQYWKEEYGVEVTDALEPEMLDKAEAELEKNGPHSRGFCSSPLPLIMEICLKLEKEDAVKRMIDECLVDPIRTGGFRRMDSFDVLQSRGIWPKIVSGFVRQALVVDEMACEDFVDEVLPLLERRLRDGRHRPFEHKTVKELLYLFEEQCFRLDTVGWEGACPRLDEGDKRPKTLLNDPATEEQIHELESRLREQGFESGLPEDYKDLLRVTNGFCSNFFYNVDKVKLDSWGAAENPELLPHGSLGYIMNAKFEWPAAAKCTDTGRNGDEGSQFVFPPASVKNAIAAFDECYENCSSRDRRLIDIAARDLYGGTEQLRNLECLVISSHHWNPDANNFGSFKDFLEYTVQEMRNVSEEEDDDGSSC